MHAAKKNMQGAMNYVEHDAVSRVLRHGEPLRDRPRDMPYLPPLKDGEPLDYQLGVGVADTSPTRGDILARAMRAPGH